MRQSLLLGVALAFAAVACGRRLPSLAAARGVESVDFEAHGEPGSPVAVLASRLWNADRPPQPAWEGSVLEMSASPTTDVAPLVLGLARVGAAPEVLCSVPDERIPEGTYAVQAVELRLEGDRIETRWSSAWVVERRGDAIALRSYASQLWISYGTTWIAGLAVLALLALGTRAVRIPTDRRPRLWLAALVVVPLSLVVPRLWRIPERWRMDAGLDVPPLFWQPEWPIEGDGVERALGPGFRKLLNAARDRQQADAPITIRLKAYDGFDMYRAIYFAFMLPRASLILGPDKPCPPGLAIFIGLPPTGAVIGSNAIGALTVVDGKKP